VKNDLNPKWRPFDVKASRLCGGNFSLPIKVVYTRHKLPYKTHITIELLHICLNRMSFFLI